MGVGWSELAEFYSCIYERQACRASRYKIYEQKFNVELRKKALHDVHRNSEGKQTSRMVSVFCSSGVVSGIRGKQMTPAVASERSIFSKNHDYNTYIKSFLCRGEHVRTYISGYGCTQWQKTTNRHTHTHTRGTATVMMTIKIIRSAEAQWV